ncbi:MAG: diaminobutyrate--2-oxoglutarate transaminase [Burkholderiales bacterium]
MSLKIFDRLESQVRGYIRSFPVVFTRARGSQLWDEDGNRYIDFFSGAGTLNYGHNNPVLKEKVIEYLESDGLIHGLDMATTAKKEFIEAFERVILRPRNLQYKLQFPGPTGTNAVEAAMKLARLVKRRTNIISFTNGFHGVTGGSLAATGNSKFRDAAGVPLGNTTFMPYAGYLGDDADSLAYLDKMITDGSSGVDTPAAVIVETVQGEGGVNVASTEWLQRLRALCDKHDMLLIVDDIQVGCGRTGTFFSFEQAGITPDIVTLSKSLSGFGLPMALVLIRPELDVWKPGSHSGTFRGNNLAFETAKQAIISYWSTDEFTKEIRRKEKIMRVWLEHMVESYPQAGFTMRGRGMIQGLVTEDPAIAGKIAQQAFTNGLIIETSGANDEVLKLLPALTISDEQLRQGLDILERSAVELLGVRRVETEKIRYVKFGGASR